MPGYIGRGGCCGAGGLGLEPAKTYGFGTGGLTIGGGGGGGGG